MQICTAAAAIQARAGLHAALTIATSPMVDSAYLQSYSRPAALALPSSTL